MKLSFEDFGSGVPVVLIHAFPLSSKMWATQADFLVSHGFRVILPDLPGFGGSARQQHQGYSLENVALQMDELLRSLNVTKAVIGGLSMGGYVLFELYRLRPELFSAVVLCDTTCAADTDEKRASRFGLISKIEQEGAIALIENMLPNLVSDETKHKNPALMSLLRKEFANVPPLSAIDALRIMAGRRDNCDILPQISVPSLLIFGAFDTVTNLEQAEMISNSISDSKLTIIDGAGHYSNLEKPEVFNEALLNFCRRIEF